MKAVYLNPSVEVVELKVQTAILNSVSGLGMSDQGQDDGSHASQAPERKVF